MMASQDALQALHAALEDENEATLAVMLQAIVARDHMALRSLAYTLQRQAAYGSLSQADILMRRLVSEKLPRIGKGA